MVRATSHYSSPHRYTALFVFFLSLFFSPLFLGFLLTPDGFIDPLGYRIALIGFQLFLLAAAYRLSRLRAPIVSLFLVACLLVGAGLYEPDDPRKKQNSPQVVKTKSTPIPRDEPIDREESVFLELTREMKHLSVAAADLRLPGRASSLFGSQIELTDLAEPSALKPWAISGLDIKERELRLGETGFVKLSDSSIWHSLFEPISHFEWCSFKAISYSRDEQGRFAIVSEFHGTARMKNGALGSVRSELLLVWKQEDDKTWKIVKWKTGDCSIAEIPRAIYSDVTGQLVDTPLLSRLMTSPFKRLMSWAIGVERPARRFYALVSLSPPGVSVVDYNNDGIDDVFLCSFLGPSMLLEGQAGGGYKDVAPEVGLDLSVSLNAAVFMDLDNDGDQDAWLGSEHQGLFLFENSDDQFVRRDCPRIDRVVSLSGSDFDRDGLLDLYIAVRGETEPDTSRPDLPFVLRTRSAPNHLLRNLGNFSFAAHSDEAIEIRRPTFQASWSDFDNDGDPDLYAANDFGANNLIVNKDGKFAEMTAVLGAQDRAFGMGVSWGDFNNDGYVDTYISNMYSKAGKRIVRSLKAGEELEHAARGNTLLRNLNGYFERVSGPKSERFAVENGGWSWGSQFVDFNNDGFLDIHTRSGFYSPPRQWELPEDL
jgi:hypothetical protein